MALEILIHANLNFWPSRVRTLSPLISKLADQIIFASWLFLTDYSGLLRSLFRSNWNYTWYTEVGLDWCTNRAICHYDKHLSFSFLQNVCLSVVLHAWNFNNTKNVNFIRNVNSYCIRKIRTCYLATALDKSRHTSLRLIIVGTQLNNNEYWIITMKLVELLNCYDFVKRVYFISFWSVNLLLW